ncbi:HAD family hydrolase [bacterium]|jgi:D,D-heptose 1,7-bisphosphate phosphatase|nr:HAD family hydrolase [bacterium]
MSKKAIFFDRDGTLIVEKNYLKNSSDVILENRVIESLHLLKDDGFLFVIITNQSGIGRGYFTEEDYLDVHLEVVAQFREHGIEFLDDYYCPHHPTKGIGSFKQECLCRKPGTLLIEQAVKEFNLNISESVFVGDKSSDIQAGLSAGMLSVHVQTGHDSFDKICKEFNGTVSSFPDLYEASKFIVT